MQIVSWGESVELVEPLALAQAIVARARRIVERYTRLLTT
jgi:predicted DNA-binding transcriptional regulator YafY